MVIIVALGATIGGGCSDDSPDAVQLPPGLTMPSTTTSTMVADSSTVPASGDTAGPGTDDPNAPLDSFTGVFRSTVLLGPADETGAPTVVDVCTYLEDPTGVTTSLLFGDDQETPISDVRGVINDGRYGYVVPDGYDPGTDTSKYSTDGNLLRPGTRTEIEGSAGELDPADSGGACPPGTDATKVIVVEKWQALPG